jgi:hypothetical protein
VPTSATSSMQLMVTRFGLAPVASPASDACHPVPAVRQVCQQVATAEQSTKRALG